MANTRAVKDLPFSEFLASLNSSSDPEGYARIAKLGSQYEAIPVKDRISWLYITGDGSLGGMADALQFYEPRVGFFDNQWAFQHRFPKEIGILHSASEAGLNIVNRKWFDRARMSAGSEPIFLEEGVVKKRLFDEFDTARTNLSYAISASLAVFFDGKSVNLGVRSDKPLNSGIWTQHGHQVSGDNWHISDYVPVFFEDDVEVFHKGVLPALRARDISNLITRFPHAFIESLIRSVRTALTDSAELGNSYIFDIGYENGRERIEPRTDLRIKEIVSSIPRGLEQSLRKLKDAGYFFEPSEIRSAYQSLGIVMPESLDSLVAQEEVAYRQAVNGIETSQPAVREGILRKGWGGNMLDFFYTFVSPKDTRALVQVIPGKSPELSQEGYFLTGRNGDAEITLSYTRNGPLSKENILLPVQEVGFFESLFRKKVTPPPGDHRKFHPCYLPNWVGAFSIETDSVNYLSNQANGPLTLKPRNAFCIATPVREWGSGGDFILCQDQRYFQLFKELAESVHDSISMAHSMHTMIG